MELRIVVPPEAGKLPEILWNHEEIKMAVAAKAQEYKTIAYTADQTADMKKDRAELNKLVNAFEDERKRVKKIYQEPYNRFEQQVKEVLAPEREAIALIDGQLNDIEKRYRDEKRCQAAD